MGFSLLGKSVVVGLVDYLLEGVHLLLRASLENIMACKRDGLVIVSGRGDWESGQGYQSREGVLGDS